MIFLLALRIGVLGDIGVRGPDCNGQREATLAARADYCLAHGMQSRCQHGRPTGVHDEDATLPALRVEPLLREEPEFLREEGEILSGLTEAAMRGHRAAPEPAGV